MKTNLLKRIGRKVNLYKMAVLDAHQFSKYSMYDNYNQTGYEYDILLKVHSLEKGFSMEERRPFGYSKIDELTDILLYARKKNFDSFALKLGESILIKWIELGKTENWDMNHKSFVKALEYSKKYAVKAVYTPGVQEFRLTDYSALNYNDFTEERHTARIYQDFLLKDDDVEYCVNKAINVPSACNRQMCKIYNISSKSGKSELLKVRLGISGISVDNASFFIITYDMSAFSSYGERNHGYFNAGIMALKFVEALQYKGIGSCFLQFTKDVKTEIILKKKLGIPQNERIAVVLSAGYLKEINISPASIKKPIEEVYRKL